PGQGHLTLPAGDDQERIGPDEGVSGPLLSSFHALQQKRIGPVAQPVVQRHRRFRVGINRLAQGNGRIGLGKPLHFGKRGVNHLLPPSGRAERKGENQGEKRGKEENKKIKAWKALIGDTRPLAPLRSALLCSLCSARLCSKIHWIIITLIEFAVSVNPF